LTRFILKYLLVSLKSRTGYLAHPAIHAAPAA